MQFRVPPGLCPSRCARNLRSAKPSLERLGLRREAHLRQNEWVKGEWTDDVTYGVLAEEWAEVRH